MDWSLYNRASRHERVNGWLMPYSSKKSLQRNNLSGRIDVIFFEEIFFGFIYLFLSFFFHFLPNSNEVCPKVSEQRTGNNKQNLRKSQIPSVKVSSLIRKWYVCSNFSENDLLQGCFHVIFSDIFLMKPMQLNQNRTLSLSSCEQMLLSFTCLFYSKFVCSVSS